MIASQLANAGYYKLVEAPKATKNTLRLASPLMPTPLAPPKSGSIAF
jgi:hypothetical protein